MNSFFGLTVGVRALSTAQAALYTVNHNISNAGTTGYSRQVVAQSASPALPTSNGAGMLGTGVDVDAIAQMRNTFLDNRFRAQNTSSGLWNVRSSALSEMETLLNGSLDNGLDDVLNAFVSSMEDLSLDPSSASERVSLRAQGEMLCRYLNNMAGTLQNQLEENNANIEASVDEINSLARQIDDLNQQISLAESGSSVANDLRDRRGLLVDRLSATADVKITEPAPGSASGRSGGLSISINGVSLVGGAGVSELECYADEAGTYAVRWMDSGDTVEFEGGEIQGYIDICTGSGLNGEYQGIPYYTNQLNTFARTLAQAFNEGIYADNQSYTGGHAGGVGLDGSTGIRFFSYDGMSSAELMESGANMQAIYSNITAANISLSADIEADTDKIAAASASGEPENSDNLRSLLDIFEDERVFVNSTPEDFVNAVFTSLGVEASFASQMSDRQQSILDYIDNNRISVSGVSIDEGNDKASALSAGI